MVFVYSLVVGVALSEVGIRGLCRSAAAGIIVLHEYYRVTRLSEYFLKRRVEYSRAHIVD